MRILTIALLSSLLVACSTHTAHKKVAKDKLIRGSVITFDKAVTLNNPHKKKGISLSLVKKAEALTKAQAGRSIASSCDFIKFCKLNAINLKPNEEAVIKGDYTVLTTGRYDTNNLKSWMLVNGDGKELQLICGVQAQSKDSNCKQKLTKLQIKDMTPFIENLLDVSVAAAK